MQMYTIKKGLSSNLFFYKISIGTIIYKQMFILFNIMYTAMATFLLSLYGFLLHSIVVSMHLCPS